MATLQYLSTILELTDQLTWVDEFGFSPVQQTISFSVTGSMWVESKARLAGRPITLESGDRSGWLTRGTLATLKQWEALPGQVFTLAIRGASYYVVMDHARKAVEATPVAPYSDSVDPSDYVAVKLRFLTV